MGKDSSLVSVESGVVTGDERESSLEIEQVEKMRSKPQRKEVDALSDTSASSDKRKGPRGLGRQSPRSLGKKSPQSIGRQSPRSIGRQSPRNLLDQQVLKELENIKNQRLPPELILESQKRLKENQKWMVKIRQQRQKEKPKKKEVWKKKKEK